MSRCSDSAWEPRPGRIDQLSPEMDHLLTHRVGELVWMLTSQIPLEQDNFSGIDLSLLSFAS